MEPQGQLFQNCAPLRVISLWQPWATWIMWGWKTVETRTHDRFRTLAGARIGIHAAKKLDPDWKFHAGRYLSDVAIDRTQNFNHAFGAMICTAYVFDYALRVPHRDSAIALIECETPRAGLFLQQIEPIEPPILMRGRQGIWTFCAQGSKVNIVTNKCGST